ncbi:DUF2500 family protein [Bacillus lacus]|uniref:DUF2500 family protein n=1 Tax=Metabacillus lacus TaxID=1983721 RepID=A0A7X2M0I2_9BACI|nr:DUF2500 domain-containing protein [Metabacillus lacus]MRX74183.1 DUF2500 family protein [Metabacillus lacus]
MDVYDESGFDNFLFQAGPIFIIIVFVIIAGVIIYTAIRNFTQWTHNNASPIVTVSARVIGKRTEISGGTGDTRSYSVYFITFEIQEQERIELQVSGKESGQIMEGDFGELTYQGTRYKVFERK